MTVVGTPVSRGQRVLVIAEPTFGETPSSTTLAALTFAQRLCRHQSATWSLVALTPERPSPDSELARLGAFVLYHCPIKPNEYPLPEQYLPTMVALACREEFDFVVAAATSYGKDLLPRLAAALKAAYIADCIGFECGSAGPKFLRPIYAGIAVARCVVASKTVVISVRASAFERAKPEGVVSPVMSVDHVHPPPIRIKLAQFVPITRERPALSEARVVVAGGRVLGDRYFDVLGPLADELGGALGATRALCDAGHAPGALQIGQTGQIVAPDLYVAVGISGSVQHLAGMRGSRTIVAINVDPQAPIFSHSDYGIVGDLWHEVPALVAAIRRRRTNDG